ncbi:MAG: lasso peptide biosynthesis B2 protein [Pseudonocardiaceae bacterium]
MTARLADVDLYGCYFDHSVVVLDYRTGATRVLHGPGLAGALQVVPFNGQDRVPPHLENEVMRALRLDGAGSPRMRLRPGRPAGLSFGAEEYDAGLASPVGSSPASAAGVVAAALALGIVLAVKHLGRRERTMHRLITLMTWTLRLPSVLATADEAEPQVRRVRRLACGLPARVACLEESIAAMVALALLGKSVTWCHGVAADPFTFHAWVRIDIAGDDTRRVGVPIAEPDSTKRYTVLRTIPETPIL